MPFWLASSLIIIAARILIYLILRGVKGKPVRTLQEELSEERRQELIARAVAPNEEADLPVAFGTRCGWFSVRTDEGRQLAGNIRLKDLERSNWENGIKAAFSDKIFITPPVDGWTLVLGVDIPFPDTDEGKEDVVRLLLRLSKEYGEAQFFSSFLPVGLECWMKARNGKLVRAYAEEDDKVLFDEGTREADESRDALSPAARMAALWSVNPDTLEDRSDVEPGFGWVGRWSGTEGDA